MRIFVTGASGWIGSAVVPELLQAGHQVVGLARSDAAADRVAALGADVQVGDLNDLDSVRAGAADSDGVIHLAFRHDLAFSGDFPGAIDADRLAIEAIGDALAGSNRPFLIASGTVGVAAGRVATEQDGRNVGQATAGHSAEGRTANARLTISLASRDIRACVVRLPPTVHGDGDPGFMAALIQIARSKSVSGYIGDGTNRWPAVHRLDAARVFALAVERAPAGSVVHAVAEEGVPIRGIAELIGRQLDVPVVSVAPTDAADHFGWLGAFLGADVPASSAATRELLGWQLTQPALLEDLGQGHYFRGARSAAA